jgi:hypothetical protein
MEGILRGRGKGLLSLLVLFILVMELPFKGLWGVPAVVVSAMVL